MNLEIGQEVEILSSVKCLLKEMLKMQKKFQDKFGFHPPLHLLASAMMHEGGEIWEASKGKWWSKKEFSREDRLEEVVDILHFWLAYCVEAGFTAEEIFEAYSKKLKENYRRQEEGY